MTPSETLMEAVRLHSFDSGDLRLGDVVSVDDLVNMANDLPDEPESHWKGVASRQKNIIDKLSGQIYTMGYKYHLCTWITFACSVVIIVLVLK